MGKAEGQISMQERGGWHRRQQSQGLGGGGRFVMHLEAHACSLHLPCAHEQTRAAPALDVVQRNKPHSILTSRPPQRIPAGCTAPSLATTSATVSGSSLANTRLGARQGQVPGRASQCWPYRGRSEETTVPFPGLEHVSLLEGISKKGLIHEQLMAVPRLPAQTQMELTAPKHRSAQ